MSHLWQERETAERDHTTAGSVSQETQDADDSSNVPKEEQWYMAPSYYDGITQVLLNLIPLL